MGEPMKILELAKKLIRLNGKTPFLGSESEKPAGSIMIKFTGLLPGEKLFEELTYEGTLKSTIHPRIFKTTEKAWTNSDINAAVDTLLEATENKDHPLALNLLKSKYPEIEGPRTTSDQFITNRL